ncbi:MULTISPECIES: MarR family winged helix-turn-helix transcriptional regulator [Streptomyces]|uniref:Transcriptional regulator n=1 Tax=Streptomyces canarius TaxID=285453 RepID=A0ABQ3D2Y6_9ACTN|nr:MarR family winged helix-turn-helix transcriptional regulator [Streptomyces canarius]GHA55055.1 transcriptional regulator [Streptomyces canarius]
MNAVAASIARWDTLTRAHRRIESRVGRHLHQRLGLGASEFHALRALDESVRAGSGLLYLNILANGIGLSQSGTSRLVTRLQDRGLVTTHLSPHDRRSVEIKLTPVGREVVRIGSPVLYRAVEEVVRELRAEGTDEDLVRYLRGSTHEAISHRIPPRSGPLRSTGAVSQSAN